MKFFCILILISQFALAIEPEEQQPEEVFSSYFARLTRGGTFSGIYLKAPIAFAEGFRKYIRKNYWMGPLEKSRRELVGQGYDLWFDIYKTDTPQKFFVASKGFVNEVQKSCGASVEYKTLAWKSWIILKL